MEFPIIKILKVRNVLGQKYKKGVPIQYLMNNMLPEPGRAIIIIGESGSGKTFTASAMANLYAKLGYGIYSNLPLKTDNELFHKVSTLSGLTLELCKSPRKRKNIVILDESSLVLAGALGGGSKTVRSMKSFILNFARKLGNCCVIMIFHSSKDPAPVFRGDDDDERSVLHATIYKVNKQTMRVTFEKKEIYDGSFLITGIPIPGKKDMVIDSRGQSSFSIDYEPSKMSDYIGKHSKGDSTLANHRKLVEKYLKNKDKVKVSGKRTGTQRLYGYLLHFKYIKDIPNNKELAKITGLGVKSIPPIKSEIIKELKEKGLIE